MLDLSSFAGKQVELGFYFYSNCTEEWPYGCITHVNPGWYIDEITIETGLRVFHNPEDWESGIDDWYTDFGVWEVGEPTSGPKKAYSGTKCAGTILDGNYWDGTPSRLISAPLTVPDASANPVLRFRNWYSFAANDYGQVWIHALGEVTWKLIATYAGSSGGVWEYPRLDSLEQYAGQQVELCFFFYSNCTEEWPYGCITHVDAGWYIDDVKIVTTCPYIYCPSHNVKTKVTAPGRVCVPLQIWNATTVTVSNGSWANDSLCFMADSLGAYRFHVEATNAACTTYCSLTVNVSGVKVGDETTTPGHTVKVPIRLLASDSLLGFTIPLKFTTTQPSKVHLDSVQIDPQFGGSAIIVGPDSTIFVDCRPVQRPPLPPDTLNPYVVAYACFRIDSDAVAEVIPIDTTTIVYNATTYSYKFYDVDTTAFVPLFVPGSLTITDTCVGPFVCGDFDGNCRIDVSDVVYLVYYVFANGPIPLDTSRGDVDCSGQVDISDAVYMVRYIFPPDPLNPPPAPCADCPKSGDLGKAASGSAEVWVEKDGDGDGTSLIVHIKSDVEVRGVQLEFESPATGDFKATGLVEGMTTLSGHKDNLFKAGLLDLSGTKAIPAGETAVMRLQTGSTDEITIVNAILVGQDARPLNVVVKESVVSSALPKQYALAQNYPNPFNPSTAINFSLPKPSPVRLEVFNTLGQRVITLMDQFCTAGNYTVNWEGANDRGESVASGVYFYRLKADEYTKTRQMVLLK